MGFPGGLLVMNLLAMQKMQEIQVQSLGGEDPLEEEMATHSSILSWRIPIDRGAWQATAHGVTKGRTRLKQLSTRTLQIFKAHTHSPYYIFLSDTLSWEFYQLNFTIILAFPLQFKQSTVLQPVLETGNNLAASWANQ